MRISTQNICYIDQILVFVKFKKYYLLLVCVYIPPNSQIIMYSKFCELVKNIGLSYSSWKILIIEDYNLASGLWLKNNPIPNPV